MNKNEDVGELFVGFTEIIARLRDPETGCPWDLKQTHQTLTPYMIEEAYEAVEAIQENPKELPGELGDVLLQVVLHSQIGKESGAFSIADVIRHVSTKMVDRHPHVFGDKKVKDEKEVLENWESSKKKERKSNQVFADIPKALPALIRSEKIGEIAARHNFDWPTAEDVFTQVEEELEEVRAELSGEPTRLAEELGDLIFSVAQLIRKLDLHPEDVLHAANKKFEARFQKVLSNIDPAKQTTREELEQLWAVVKEDEGN